jgi:hypothetical protein
MELIQSRKMNLESHLESYSLLYDKDDFDVSVSKKLCLLFKPSGQMRSIMDSLWTAFQYGPLFIMGTFNYGPLFIKDRISLKTAFHYGPLFIMDRFSLWTAFMIHHYRPLLRYIMDRFLHKSPKIIV